MFEGDNDQLFLTQGTDLYNLHVIYANKLWKLLKERPIAAFIVVMAQREANAQADLPIGQYSPWDYIPLHTPKILMKDLVIRSQEANFLEDIQSIRPNLDPTGSVWGALLDDICGSASLERLDHPLACDHLLISTFARTSYYLQVN